MKTLETERLILRSWRDSDLESLYEYAKNPNIGPNAGWKPHESIEESQRILQDFIEKDEVWAIVLKENEKVIGSIGLHPDGQRHNDKARKMGYVLAEDYWGMGLGTEAARRVIQYGFEEFDLDIIGICHYLHNYRSRRIIEKCGFRYEGTIRRGMVLYDGSIYDSCCYSMTKEEYQTEKVEPHGVEISTDPRRFQLERIVAMLQSTHWASKRSKEVIEKSMRQSICFGVYLEGLQIGFARAVTDFATTYYICDVVIDSRYRGRGYGQKLLEAMVNYEEFPNMYGTLITMDAHGFYEKFGFRRNSTGYMNKFGETAEA